MSRRKRVVVRLALRPVSRRWLLLAAMLASLPLSGQNQSFINASFPTPEGAHGRMLVTGGAGASGLSAFGRLGGTTLVGTAAGAAAVSPGASLAVAGNTLIGDITDGNQTALSAYALTVGKSAAGPQPGIAMEDRTGVGGYWAMVANGGKLNFWNNGTVPLTVGQNGQMPLCTLGPQYTFPGDVFCPVGKFAPIAVDGTPAHNRIAVGSCPGPSGSCPIYGAGGNAPNIAGGYLVCCNFN